MQAMFRAEMLPKEFNRILQEKWFGRALTARHPTRLGLLACKGRALFENITVSYTGSYKLTLWRL